MNWDVGGRGPTPRVASYGLRATLSARNLRGARQAENPSYRRDGIRYEYWPQNNGGDSPPAPWAEEPSQINRGPRSLFRQLFMAGPIACRSSRALEKGKTSNKKRRAMGLAAIFEGAAG